MKNKLSEFFMDGDKMFSATRLAFLLWSIGLFFIWAVISFIKKDLVEIPQSVVEVTLGFMLGKAGGAFIENYVNNPKINTPIIPINSNQQNNNIPPGFQMPPPQ